MLSIDKDDVKGQELLWMLSKFLDVGVSVGIPLSVSGGAKVEEAVKIGQRRSEKTV